MTGLMLKDLLIGKRYLRSLLVIALFYILMAFTMNIASMLSFLVVLFAIMFCMTTFAYDDQAKWDCYASTLPMGRSKIVRARYVVTFGGILAGSAVSTIFAAVISLVKKTELTELLPACLGSAAAGLILISFYLPMIYKFGTEKSRYVMIGAFACLGVAGYFIRNWQPSLPELSGKLLLAGALLLMVGIIIASYSVSVKIYSKKEF